MTTFEFFHQRMDVYQVSVEFVRFVRSVDPKWFTGQAHRKNQLHRASDSIVLNFAEGHSQPSRAVRRNHYRIALGSAAECHAILGLMEIDGCAVREGQQLLARIGAMLSRLLH